MEYVVLLSALHVVRQIQPFSPLRAMSTVRFVTVDVKVAQLPTNDRTATVRSTVLWS
jgi:hypothetical protein